jgi:phosphohistidine phosphatase
MLIYLAQHAEAVDKDKDPTRPVSRQGMANATRVAGHLAELGISISAIRHSGKLRAEQTAEIFSDSLGVTDVAEIIGMGPNDDVEGFVKSLTSDRVLYIGHLPHLDRALSQLIGGNRDQGVVTFKNAGVVCVNIGDSENSLVWYLSPDIC